MTLRADISRRLGLLALVAALAACLTLASPAAAKKKKKRGGTVDATKTVNLPIPDAINDGGILPLFGVLTSTIDVGKQFKGRKVRDVNATVQTIGTTGMEPAEDLRAQLTSPNGATTILFSNLNGIPGSPTHRIGPLTLDDEALLDLGESLPDNPTELFSPWAGTAAPRFPLAVMDDGPVRGTWTLTMVDQSITETSNLVLWRLNVIAGRPFQTK